MIRLPYHLEGILETSSGKKLPLEVSFSRLYRGRHQVFSLLTFPLNGYFELPAPGVSEEHLVSLWFVHIQSIVTDRHARILDSEGHEINLVAMVSAFSDDNPDRRVYSKTEDFDELYGLTKKKPGKHYWGGFDRAFKRCLKREPKPGQCHMVDGWCVWEKACS